MRKLFVIVLSLFFCLAVITAPVFAGGNCCAAKSTAKSVVKASACPSTKSAGTTAIYDGKCVDITLAIEGMEDAGSETKIEKALGHADGVIMVASVDYKEGKAAVCYNPDETKADKLLSAVTDLGYKATVESQGKDKVACIMTSEKCKLICESKKRQE